MLCLIVLCGHCIQGQIDSTAKFTLYRWQAVKALQDAARTKKYRQLTDSLKVRVSIWEEKNISDNKYFNDQVKLERDRIAVQSELVGFERSLKEQAREENKKIRRGRTLARIGIPVGFLTGMYIGRRLWPP